MKINKEDISLFHGEDSGKITKAFKFDMDKILFISESDMARRETRDSLEYVEKLNTRLTKFYYFGKCIMIQSGEYMREYF